MVGPAVGRFSPAFPSPRIRRCFTLIELLVVIGLLALLISVLLPALSRARKAALSSKMMAPEPASVAAAAQVDTGPAARPAAEFARALIRSFEADITLLPRLSVGTAEPESIYEARFAATLRAASPTGQPTDCEVELPLPPQIISLADLSVQVNGNASESVTLRDGKLLWHGPLTAAPTSLAFTYTAVGKGLYVLNIPPGAVLDTFKITLAAHESDVRMLELSLQPTALTRAGNVTSYTWDYKRLMLGRPIQLDVLGIAPIDRLGELSWLAPISLVAFGFVVGLVAYAYRTTQFDRWTLLLVLGTFAGTYPLMYFAQEFIPLRYAVLGSCGLTLAIIAVRATLAMRLRLGTLGVVVPAILILAVTLTSAVHPRYQGILLTGEALAFFVFAMALLPKLQLRLPMRPVPAGAVPA